MRVNKGLIAARSELLMSRDRQRGYEKEGWKEGSKGRRELGGTEETTKSAWPLREGSGLWGVLLGQIRDLGLLWHENGQWRQPIGRTFRGKTEGEGTVHFKLSASLGQPGVHAQKRVREFHVAVS